MSNPDFGAWLKRLRTTHDLTQETLAEAVGCAAETVRSFENGRRRPSRQMAERLADVLRLAPAERQNFVQLARVPQIVPALAGGDTLEQALPLADVPRRQRPSPVYLPPDALIGRQDELLRLRAALVDDARRLVTLLGPGGIGKTRLALQVAADLAPHFADGAAFVALAPLADPAHVAPAIAEALGTPLSNAQPHDAALIEMLRSRRLLLVLDNLEHLLGGEQDAQIASLLTRIMNEAPGIQVLITSRQRIKLRGAWVIELDALAIPAAGSLSGVERSDAVLLFLERARQVDDDFALTANNRAAVVRICRLLGGVPLAIELAATWLRALTCSEIAAEIEHSFDFLALGDSDLPPRHQSLRAVMDHSWELLAPAEQLLLMRMSVFPGGCRREAVAAVSISERSGDQRPAQRAELLALLAALVDKSLLRRVTDHDGATRYTLHEMVRQYAATQHAELPGDVAATEARHAAYYASWVESQDHPLKSAQQKETVRSIMAEIDNVRAAWRWACEHCDATLLRQMLVTLDWFYELRGWHTEGATAFAHGHEQLAPTATTPEAPAYVQSCYWLLVGREGWHMLRRDPMQAAYKLQTAVDHLRQVDYANSHIHCIKGLAYLKIFIGDYASAEALLDETLALATADGDLWQRAVARVVRGVLEVLRSDATTAREYLVAALSAAREGGDPRHIALTLNYLGVTALSLELFDEAERDCRECLSIAAENKDRFQMSLALLSLGRVALSRGDAATSAWMFDEGHSLAREIGDRWLEAQARGYQGTLAVHQGNRVLAGTHLRASVTIAAAAPLPFALDALAMLAEFELEAQPQAALTTLAYVRRHPRTRSITRAAAEAYWQEAAESGERIYLMDAEEAAAQQPQGQPAALLALFE